MALTDVAHAQRGRGRTPTPPDAQSTTPATPPPAGPTAADTAQARAYFQQGQAAYARGDYEESIRVWNQAYAVDPAPLLQYNLAQAYGRLGDVPNELATLRRYVETAPQTDANIAPSRMRIAALEERMARTGIHLVGVDASAEVTLDGDLIPVPPVDAIIAPAPGTHRIHIRLRGHRPYDSVVEVVSGRTTDLEIRQETVREAETPTAGLVLLSAGGALLVTGAVTGAISFVKSPDAFVGTPAGDRYHAMALASDITIGVGAAAAATGLVLVLIRDRGESDEYDVASARVVPYVSTSGGGLSIVGRF